MRTVSTEDLMLDAAYIVKGFFEAINPGELGRTEMLNSGGEVNVVAWLTQFAHDIENVWAASEKDPAAVWCYEVAEPVGRFIAETVNRYGEFPSAGIVRQIAHEYATEALGEDA